jgi:hypothetical protein
MGGMCESGGGRRGAMKVWNGERERSGCDRGS